MFWNVYFLNSISLNRERAYLLNHAAFHLLRWGFVWSWLSSKYFQAKALVTYGMIVLVMLGKAKIGNILFGTTESVFVIKIYCLYFFIMSAISFWQAWQWQWWRWWHDNDNGYEKDDDDDDDNVGDDDNGDESGGWLMMMIVMTIKVFVGQLAYTKTKAIVTSY